MRILILTNKMPYPPRDGGSIASLALSEALTDVGNQVTILSMNTNKHFVRQDELPAKLTQKIKFIIVPINTDISFNELLTNLLFSKKPYNAERFISDNYKTELEKELKSENYDLVQLEGLYLCPYIDTIRQNSNAKIALRSHNIEHEIWQRAATNEKNLVKKGYKNILKKRIKNFKLDYLNKYDFLVPITERDGKKYSNLGNIKPIHVTPPGIDGINYIKDDTNSKFPGIFHIGALDWIPNQEGLRWFIDNVWIKFKKNYPQFEFYLAGRNAPKRFEKYLADKQIVYLGEIENANKFINENSIMIVPLLSGSGMRIKIIEGMVLGKSIITTSIGAEGIPTTDGENILIADNPQTFYENLERICLNIELHKKISSNAIEFVNTNFDNINIAKNLTEFYKNNINA
ncbi:MAG: glycosyltransferase family 4 protein [Bacteroidales bacterium]|nr:glycosyltransferase family 4 protein [Bacteroidales bacterium]MDD4217355.1 glycosyltransferase family 4 protein [Bacteroidales bacterium]MDY0140781.1 glycosyltransferase family 4 protein [Bacteroidales bacterium]